MTKRLVRKVTQLTRENIKLRKDLARSNDVIEGFQKVLKGINKKAKTDDS